MSPEKKGDRERHPLEGSGLQYFRDAEGQYFVPMNTAIEITGFRDGHLRGLAIKGRIDGIKPGGRDWLFSYDSIQEYLESGRSFGGRPRKNSS